MLGPNGNVVILYRRVAVGVGEGFDCAIVGRWQLRLRAPWQQGLSAIHRQPSAKRPPTNVARTPLKPEQLLAALVRSLPVRPWVPPLGCRDRDLEPVACAALRSYRRPLWLHVSPIDIDRSLYCESLSTANFGIPPFSSCIAQGDAWGTPGDTHHFIS